MLVWWTGINPAAGYAEMARPGADFEWKRRRNLSPSPKNGAPDIVKVGKGINPVVVSFFAGAELPGSSPSEKKTGHQIF